MDLHNFRLNKQGLTRLFGKLEAKIMAALWDMGEASVQEVVDRLGKGTNYKTVMTVMNRLTAKGFLERRKVSRAFIYMPNLNREELNDHLSRLVLDSLITDFGPKVLAQFVEAVAEADQAHLDELLTLIEDRFASENGAYE
jgi:predicted transcriptional regulator